ncbi:NAD(P)/FAD-dependent oxidoreductase [Wukongibacter baidiensis]|uniref:NAD(P)/FAD-dependent oxidoreductase n=1 Tax=Wukongibacter baidiensis TaxID=1723361 RepID=UPI003D7FDF55
MKNYDVIVVGAGPAGLFAAINSGGENRRVLVLERNASAGKKLLISGAGQCNLTHEGNIKDFLNFYGDNGRFVKHSLFKFTNEDLMNFFRQRGLNFISNENGKIFPETLKASDVLNVLLDECKKRNVDKKYNQRVTDVDYDKEKSTFDIKTEKQQYSARYLVVSTGGKSYVNTGSTGDGYNFARKLGHVIEKPRPCLTPLYIKDYGFTDLSGTSFENIPISLWRNNKKIKNCLGDVLLTHRNISGPGILNFSRYVLPGDIIKINFIGAESEEGFRSDFIERISSNGKLLVKTILREYPLSKRFIDKLIAIADIPEELKCAELNKKMRNRLIEMLIGFPMEVERLGDYHIAMATKGGVSLKDVSPKTMESRIVKGLYFVGEVLDIDGDTGGYNIQAAFSMGKLAAESITNKMKGE